MFAKLLVLGGGTDSRCRHVVLYVYSSPDPRIYIELSPPHTERLIPPLHPTFRGSEPPALYPCVGFSPLSFTHLACADPACKDVCVSPLSIKTTPYKNHPVNIRHQPLWSLYPRDLNDDYVLSLPTSYISSLFAFRVVNEIYLSNSHKWIKRWLGFVALKCCC